MLTRCAARMLSSRRHPRASPQLIRTPTLFCRSRDFHLEGIALAPVVFGGLFVALWTWKCTMMVVFQNKIIYMPNLPPNSRWERIENYASRCGGIDWREERTRAADGTQLALCVADMDIGNQSSEHNSEGKSANFYVLYFQGNGASTPPRLPDISSVFLRLKRCMHDAEGAKLTVVLLSYRGYWTSKGSPNENGIRLDAAATLEWISQQHEKSRCADTCSSTSRPAGVILWGQSIGCGVATNLAAENPMPRNLHLNSIVLETPFTSIRAMLEVLYPQKWLPYKYLWPFLRNHLDSMKNLGIIAEKNIDKSEYSAPRICILEAAKDELVPAQLSQKLLDRTFGVDLPVEKRSIAGAFHNDVIFRAEGRKAVAEFIAQRIKGHLPR